MPPSNLEATVMILDVGPSTSSREKDEKSSFFDKSRSCISRIVERKIFSRPNDLVGVVLMGTEETNNGLSGDPGCEHISVAVQLSTPSWDLIETLANKVETTNYNSDWIGALKVAADFMQNELGNKKVNHKKIVLMTDLKLCPKVNEDVLAQLVATYELNNLELIVIGPEIWTDEDSESCTMPLDKTKSQHKSETILKKIVSDLNGMTCTFEEAILQLIFHKKKATNLMPWNVDLCIGSNVSIPVSGFGKIRDDKTIGQWRKTYKDPLGNKNISESIVSKKSYYKKEDNTIAVDELDIVYGYLYGQTIVPFTKLDKAMEYESGPRCLTVFGCTKQSNIYWNNLAGDGLTYVVARKGNDNAKVALDAFITNLKELKLVAIARKVYNKNNAPHMVVLFPLVENEYKCLSMISLAFKEDYRHLTFPSLDKKMYSANDEQIKAVDDLIDAMNLSEVDENEKEFLSLEDSVNPVIQHFFDTISYRALHPNEPLPLPRQEVQDLLEIPVNVAKLMSEPLESVKNNFELKIHEKVKSGKYWVDQNLKQENSSESNVDQPVKKDYTNGQSNKVLSVMSSQTTRVGTVQPGYDFKELLLNGEPFDTVCEQMIEVIERLVLLTIGSNYIKPVHALKTLREECVLRSPFIFNNWISQFKLILLERSKKDFFNILVEQKLGLIAKGENSESTVTEANALSFYDVGSNQIIENPVEMDISEIDDLFD